MISIKPTTRWPNEPSNWWPIRIHELGQQVVDQLSKTNRQQVVEEIRHQAGDKLSVTIRQQPADGMKLFHIFLTSTAKILYFSYRLIINHIRYDVRIFG